MSDRRGQKVFELSIGPCYEGELKVIWTSFSMLLFLWLGFIASNAFGGSIYLLLSLLASVSLIKILQSREHLSESFHGNS